MFKIRAVHSSLVFILCLCLGCEQSKEVKEKPIEPKCISSQSDCFIKLASGEFVVLFNRDPVITETPFDISLISHTQHTIKNISAHMEGKNMFMGKVPLFFEVDSDDELTTSVIDEPKVIAQTSKLLKSSLVESSSVEIDLEELNSYDANATEFSSTDFEASAIITSDTKAPMKKTHYVANTMLGSCSEENMRWIIYFKVSLENAQGEPLTEHFTVEFDSLRL
ncbi:hypothetical protein ACPUVO_14370 [Pseudocolwellia sp. HL-MZ19]|uniref:hypothetical protein n=1 Tax=Pseudocolwellia sp. HL-MZ19 TaxID=3400846 RepID=UPI003CF9CAC2